MKKWQQEREEKTGKKETQQAVEIESLESQEMVTIIDPVASC